MHKKLHGILFSCLLACGSSSALAADTSSDSCVAEFNPDSLTLHIPCISVPGGGLFEANLRLTGAFPIITFEVLDASLKDDSSSDDMSDDDSSSDDDMSSDDNSSDDMSSDDSGMDSPGDQDDSDEDSSSS